MKYLYMIMFFMYIFSVNSLKRKFLRNKKFGTIEIDSKTNKNF